MWIKSVPTAKTFFLGRIEKDKNLAKLRFFLLGLVHTNRIQSCTIFSATLESDFWHDFNARESVKVLSK